MCGNQCKICKEIKPLDEFETFKIKDKYSYKRKECKKCRSIKGAARRYKLTFEEVKKLKSSSNCEICNIDLSWSDRYIDHNHKTGAVRGILCPRCNSVLELFEQSDHLIEHILEYLKKYN
jgi:peptide subunit release factor 1 (eRF1)